MGTTLSSKERKRLQAILDSTYSDAVAKGGLVGGTALGTLAALYPAVYSTYDLNPYRNEDQEKAVKTTNKLSIAGTAGGGFAGGYVIGALANAARLALQKRKARQLLGKQADWTDYAKSGLTGAALGAGGGMALNFALGRKLLDKRMLLAGLGAGGAIGTAAGHLKHLQHKGYDAMGNTLHDCVQRDASGKVIKMKRVDGDEKTPGGTFTRDDKEGLPLMQNGLYFVKTGPVGVKGADNLQAVKDTAGHDQLVIISDTPLNPSKYMFQGKEHEVRLNQMENGQWCLTVELAVGRTGSPDIDKDNAQGTLIKDRHGNFVKDTAVVNLNHHWVAPDRMNNEYPDGSKHDFNEENRAWAGNDIAKAANGSPVNQDYMVYKFTDDPRYNSQENLQKMVDSVVTHSMQYDGRLAPWSVQGPMGAFVTRLAGKRVYDNATCMTFARWVANGLKKEGLLPKNFSDKYFGGAASIAYNPGWGDDVGISAYGPWEPTEVVRNRQSKGEPDPILKNPGYQEGFEFVDNIKDGIQSVKDNYKKLKKKLTFGVFDG